MAGTGSVGVSTVALPRKAKPVKLGTIKPDIKRDVDIIKLTKQIEKAKTNAQKNELFLSVYGEDRTALIQHIILSMPPGRYLLKREGMASPSLEREIKNKYGVYAGISDLEKNVLGLSVTSPDRVAASFTHGLDDVEIKASKPQSH